MKIAFSSCNCLMDRASGAARSVRTILEYLAARGHDVCSVTGAMFDAPDQDSEEKMLASLGFSAQGDGVCTLDYNGVHHIALQSGSNSVSKMTPANAARISEGILTKLGLFAPDVLLSYGGTTVEMTVRAQMVRRGVANAFYLANPNYKDSRIFDDCDVVLTDTHATREHYAGTLGIEAVPIGKFIRPFKRIKTETPRYVTFINPSFVKGVTLFFRIAEMMQQQVPNALFQVIESRATLRKTEEQSRLPFSRLANIRPIGPQQDMTRAYSRTKVLLLPSLWHDSGPRVGLEAMSLGIPVLGSNHSGIRETLGSGGILFDVPDKMRDEPRLIPPSSLVLPWVAALTSLLTDDDAYAEASAKAKARWQEQLAEDRIGELETLLLKLRDTV